jgi:hypothetical protein
VVNFSTADAVKASFRNLVPGWRVAWGALILYAVTASAVAVIFRLLPPGSARTSPVSGLVVALATVPAWGALLRLGLRERHPGDGAYRIGPAGLQWRAGEWRIVGSTLLLLLTLLAPFGLIMAAYFGLSSAGVVSVKIDLPTPAVSPAGPTDVAQFADLAVAALIPLAVVCAFAAIVVRLAGTLPASIERKRLVLFAAWPLTRGGFWPILAASLVVGVANVALSVVGDLLSMIVGALGPSGGATLVVTAADGLVQGLCRIALLPAIVGLTLYVYRTAAPDPRLANVFD